MNINVETEYHIRDLIIKKVAMFPERGVYPHVLQQSVVTEFNIDLKIANNIIHYLIQEDYLYLTLDWMLKLV